MLGWMMKADDPEPVADEDREDYEHFKREEAQDHAYAQSQDYIVGCDPAVGIATKEDCEKLCEKYGVTE